MDAAKIGHIGVEVVAFGGLAIYLINQNRGLQRQIDELRKQLSHVAVHVDHTQKDLRAATEKVRTDLTQELQHFKERDSDRELLRSPRSPRDSPPRSRRSREAARAIVAGGSERPERSGLSARDAAREAIRNPPVETRRTGRRIVRSPSPPATLDVTSKPPSPDAGKSSTAESDDDDDVESVLRNRSA